MILAVFAAPFIFIFLAIGFVIILLLVQEDKSKTRLIIIKISVVMIIDRRDIRLPQKQEQYTEMRQNITTREQTIRP